MLVNATVEMLRVRSVKQLVKFRPADFSFDLIPSQQLHGAINKYRNNISGPFPEDELKEYVTDNKKILLIVQILKAEREACEKFKDIINN